MAPKLSEDEIDDLIYLARAGEDAELSEVLSAVSEREGVSIDEVVTAARDEGKATCLHMAAANGHLSKSGTDSEVSPARLVQNWEPELDLRRL